MRRSPAFTLIEVLLAIALLGVILSLVYTALFQVTGGAQVLTQEMSEDQELRLLMRMIAQDVQAVQFLETVGGPQVPANARHASGLLARTKFAKHGDYAEVNFHAAVPARQHRGRPEAGDPMLHEVGYFVREDVNTGVLSLYRREDYYIDDNIETGGVTAVLAKHIEAFQVECLLPPLVPGQQEEVWSKDWDSMQRPAGARLPVAIRITLAQEGKAGRHLKGTMAVNLLLVPLAKP